MVQYGLPVHRVLQVLPDKRENTRKNSNIMNGHERTIYILLIMGCNLTLEKGKLLSHGCV